MTPAEFVTLLARASSPMPRLAERAFDARQLHLVEIHQTARRCSSLQGDIFAALKPACNEPGVDDRLLLQRD
jgi:hypothetical protein